MLFFALFKFLTSNINTSNSLKKRIPILDHSQIEFDFYSISSTEMLHLLTSINAQFLHKVKLEEKKLKFSHDWNINIYSC